MWMGLAIAVDSMLVGHVLQMMCVKMNAPLSLASSARGVHVERYTMSGCGWGCDGLALLTTYGLILID
jgi:hypothetical protein